MYCPVRSQLEALAPGDVPWERPCKYELDVALEGLTAVSGPEAPALSLVFLVDGSGSVTEGARALFWCFLHRADRNLGDARSMCYGTILRSAFAPHLPSYLCAEDFSTMTNFMSTAVDCIAASHPDAKVPRLVVRSLLHALADACGI